MAYDPIISDYSVASPGWYQPSLAGRALAKRCFSWLGIRTDVFRYCPVDSILRSKKIAVFLFSAEGTRAVSKASRRSVQPEMQKEDYND